MSRVHASRSFHDAASSISGIPNPYPRGEAYGNSRRNQTIISLLNVLSELTNDSSLDNDANFPPAFEDDDPTIDEKLQIAGSESFNKFESTGLHVFRSTKVNFGIQQCSAISMI
ncbi:hypothetical protein F4604DRAFT_1268422 [Suillus subluteus]|nr:hypothetical protein F4604DRAFT_1268422 [Suillus subluteus]